MSKVCTDKYNSIVGKITCWCL